MLETTTSPTLYILCGLPGAGKTTLAKLLETERNALRLTPDEWMIALGFDLFDEAARARIEALQWQVAERALRLGVDVVQDWGLWSRSERDHYRERAAALGARSEVRYLDVSVEDLWSRLEARNAHPEQSAPITKSQLLKWARLFEPPDER